MAERLDEREIVRFEELLIANTIQIDTVTQLLIQKGFFTEDEFYAKLKEVQHEWEMKKRSRH